MEERQDSDRETGQLPTAEPPRPERPGRLAVFARRWRCHPALAALRLLALLLVLLAVVGAAALFLAFQRYRPELESWLGRVVEDQSRRLFAVEATFSRMEISALGNFTFHDFRLADPHDSTGWFLTSDRIEVRFDPLYLLWRGITLTELEIHGGDIYIHRDRLAHSTNINRLFRSRRGGGGGGGMGSRVRLRKFVLDDCRVRLVNIDDQEIDNRVHRLEGSFTRIAGELAIEVGESSVNTNYWKLGEVAVSGIFVIRRDWLGFRGTRAVKGATDLTGNGFVDFDKESYEYALKPGTVDLEHLPESIRFDNSLHGVARVSGSFGGSFDSSRVDLALAAPQGEFFGYPVRDFSSRLVYDSGRLAFEGMDLEILDGRARAELEFRFGRAGAGYTVRLEADRVRPGQLQFPRLRGIEGVLSGSLQLEGSGYDAAGLTLSGRARGLRGQLFGVPIDSAGTAFSYRRSQVTIDDLAVYSRGALATALGDVRRGELFLFVLVEDLPLSRVRRFLPAETAGLNARAEFSGSLTGSLEDPAVKGTFGLDSLSWREFRAARAVGDADLEHLFTGAPRGQVELSLERVGYRELALESVQAQAEVLEDGRISFHPLVAVLDSASRLQAEGILSLGPGSGKARVLLDSLQASYRGVEFRSGGSTLVEITPDSVRVPSLRASALEGELQGTLGFYGEGGLHADLSFDEINLSHLARLAGTPARIEGMLGGHLRAGGTRAAPRVELEIGVRDPFLAVLSGRRLEAEAVLVDNELRISRLELSDSTAALTASGVIPVDFPAGEAGVFPLEEKRQISLTARLQDYPISRVVTETLPLSAGVLAGDLRIGGTLSDPDLEGELTLREGRGLIAPINMRLDRMNGRILFEPDAIRIEEFSSSSPEGRLMISGRIPLKGLRPDSLDLKVFGREMVFQQFRYVTTLRMNADLTATGPIGDPLLAGQVQVIGGEVNPLIGQGMQMSEEQRAELAREAEPIRLPASPIDYDLRIRATDDFWLRNRNANIKLEADIHAVQRDSLPVINGEIRTVAGFYNLYGRRFRIRQGYIRFRGQADINPLLYINAERSVRGKVLRSDFFGSSAGYRSILGTTIPGEQYEIDLNTFELRIAGTLSSPQFEIAVLDRDNRAIELPITQETARMLVIFDQTFQEFQQQAGLSQSKLLDQAANLALNQANPYLQEFTGLDELSFESQLFDQALGSQDPQDRASAKIILGEFLSESIFFSFSQDLIDPAARSAQIEYILGRTSSLVTQTDSRGHFSLDYRFRLRY